MEIMPSLSEELCLVLMKQFRCWFGPPAIKYLGVMIDGRIRAKVGTKYSNRMMIPVRTCLTRGEAAGLLSLCGHYERADKYLSEGAKADLTVLISETWLPSTQAIALFVASNKIHKAKCRQHYSRQVRMQATRRLRALQGRLEAVNEGVPLTTDDALNILRRA